VRGPRSLPDEVESRGDSHPLSKATTSLHLSLFPLLGGVPVILPCRAPTTVHVNIECHRILLKSLRRTDACYYSVWGASRSSKPDAPVAGSERDDHGTPVPDPLLQVCTNPVMHFL